MKPTRVVRQPDFLNQHQAYQQAAPTRKAPIELPKSDNVDNDSVFSGHNEPVSPSYQQQQQPSPTRQPVYSPPQSPMSPTSPPPPVPSQPPPSEPAPKQPSPERAQLRHQAAVQQPIMHEDEPEPPQSPPIVSNDNQPRTRNLLRDSLPPRQTSDDEEEDDNDWGDDGK